MKKVFLTLSLIVFVSANAVSSLEAKPTLKTADIDCNDFATFMSGTDDVYDDDWQKMQSLCVDYVTK